MAKAEYFPTISLTGLFGYASTELSDLLKSSANIWGLSGLALGPIFTGGRLAGQVRASEAVQKQALVSYLQTLQTAFREVDDSLVTIRTTREEHEAQGQQVEALKQYARYAQLRYDEGQVSYIEVLDSERRLFDAELVHVQTQNGLNAALVGAYKAMGGGWVHEAEQVANAIDYPPAEGTQPLFDYPPPTGPGAVEALREAQGSGLRSTPP